MARIFGLFGTALSLVGVYLLLTRAAGATSIIKSLSAGSVSVFRTLQGR